MAQRTIPSQLHGVIVYDANFGVGVRTDAETTATQGEPGPGLTTNETLSTMELQQGGGAWNAETLTVTAIQGGDAVAGAGAVRVTWTGEAGKSGTTERGWLPYNVPTGWMALATAANGVPAGVGTPIHPMALRLKNGDVLVAFEHSPSGVDSIGIVRYSAETAGGYTDTSFGTYNSGSGTYSYSASDAYTWTVDAVVETDLNSSAPTHPCLVELPGGKLLLFFVSLQSYRGGTQYYVLGLATSSDGGSTWDLAAIDTGARIDATGNTPLNLVVVAHNGYLTALMVHDNGGSLSDFGHFYSASGGASWVEITDPYSTPLWSPQAVACDDGTVLVAWIDTDGYVQATRKRTPAQAVKTPEFILHPGTGAAIDKYSEGPNRLAMCMGTERTIHLMGVVAATGSTSERLRYARFFQDVDAIDEAIQIPGPGDLLEGEPLDYADGIGGAQHPYARSLVQWGDRLSLFWDTPTSSKTIAQFFGGSSSIDFHGPSFGMYNPTGVSDTYGIWWDATYAPSTVAAWTSSGVGAESSSVEQALSLDFTGGASTRTYSRICAVGAPVVMWVRHRQDSGGSLSSSDSGLKLRSANGVYDYDIVVRFSTTGVRVVDENNASATIGTDATGLTASAVRDYMVSLGSTGRVVLWYKAAESDVWIQGPTGNATNDSATPNAASLIAWGHSSLSTQKSTWFEVGSSADDYGVWPGSVIEPNQPRLEFGREVTLWPAYLADGRTVRATRIPALVPDQWTLSPAWKYPLDALDPLIEPSPSVAWRSVSDAAAQVIGWDMGAALQPLSPGMGIYLRNPNFLSFTLQSYSGGAWSTVATVSTVAISGAFSRTGYMVVPTGSVGSISVARDELVGSWVVLEDGGTGSLYYRKIAAHSPGIWSAGTDDLPIQLKLEGDLTGLPTTGTLSIIAPEVVRVEALGAIGPTKWRIQIPARSYVSAPEDYHTASVLLIGPYIPFGQPYAYGRTLSLEPLQTISTANNGRRRVQRLAPRGRRAVELPFTDPILALDIYYSALSLGVANTIALDGSGTPAAFAHDPRMVEDLLLAAQGARYPVVYLAALTPPEGTVVQRDLILYGRIINPTTRTSVTGTEGVNETFTISALRIEEEL